MHRASHDGVDYAVKIFDAPPADPGQVLACFRREAALLAGVADPRLPAVHEVGLVDGRPYLVMDLFDGRPLADLLRHGPLEPGRAVRLCLDLAGPLARMHAAGVIHRDVKPHNIMVLDDGSARLIDFGLAVHEDSTVAEPAPAPLVVGTLAYASPEQAGTLRRPVDHRSDLYSLGVVLFECLTGVPPFATSDTGELLRRHATEAAPDPRSLVPVGPGLAAVVNRLLAKDPDDRYRSAGTLIEDVGRLAADPDADLDAGVDRLGPAAGAVPPRSRARLCGRAAERAALAGYWWRAREGVATNCVLTGPAGMGLTRLAAEIGELARGDGAVVLDLACRDDDRLPFGSLRAAVEKWLGEIAVLPIGRRTVQHDRIRAAAADAGGLLAHLSPCLGEILGAAGPADADRQDGFASAAADFLAGLARSGAGMLFLIDDAPLLDNGSGRVLARLLGQAERTPLLVLATVCADRVEGARSSPALRLLRDRADAELDLQPLDDDGVAELVASRLPGVDVGSGLARLLGLRSQGNPLIAVEYLRAVVDGGLLSPHWGRWTIDVDGLDALELPADALGLVTARIDRLEDTDRRLLTIAAVIGSRFDPEVLAEVAGIDLDHATTALAYAAAEQLVGTRDDTGTDHQFLHAEIRTALLDGVGAAELSRLHHAVAAALERRYHARERTAAEPTELVFAIAGHHLAARPRNPGEPARAMWRLAGRLALDGHAPAQAVTYLEPAADSGPVDAELLLLLGTAYARDGRFAAARRRLDDALVVERDPVRRAQVLLLITEVERDRWDTGPAWRTARQGLSELGCLPSTNRVAQALGAVLRLVLGLLIILCGRRGTARGPARVRAAVTCELHRAAGYLAVIKGQPELHLLHALYAVPSLCRLGSGPEYALGLGSLGVLGRMLRLARLSEHVLGRAESAAAEAGGPRLAAQVEWYRAFSAYLGGADDGERWQQAVERHGQWYHAGQVCDAIATFVWEAAALGDTARARSWYERSHRLVARSERASTPLPISSAVVMTAEGRPVEAAAELDRIDGADGGPTAGLRAIVLLARLHALVEQGEFGRPFDELVAQFAAIGPRPRQMIRQLRFFLAHLALGRLAQWRAAVERGDAAAVAAARVAARRAVRDLARTAVAPHETAFVQLARAETALLDGRPDRALRILGRMPPVRQVAPILEFERSRSTARALAAAGYPVPARSQARTAMILAGEAGLARRAHAVAQEFGLDPSTGAASSGSARWAAGSGSTGIDALRLEALQEISLAASTVLDRGELARICLDRTLRILSAERAVLFLVPDGDPLATGREPLVPYLGRDVDGRDVGRLTGYSASLVERVRGTGEPVVVTGTEEGAALGAQSVVLHGLRSIMVAPLQLEGRMLGVVYLDSQVARGIFTAADAGILTALTTHIATALETARAAELEVSMRTAERQRDFAEALRARLEEMAAALEPGEVLRRLVAAIPTTLPGVTALLVPEGARELDDVEVRDLLDRHRPVTGGGPAPRVLADRLPPGAAWSAHPLRAADRRVGLLVLHARSVELLSATEIDLAGVLIGQAMTVYERASLFSRVQELAVMDELTGLANRRRFFEVAERDLAAAQLHGRPMHAMMIDIDHFKQVNDSYGHPIGDEVIRAVAQRLRHQTRETDILGRYGGEEFALVFSDVGASAAEFADRLRSTISSDPIQTMAGPLPVTVSIGVATHHTVDTIGDVLARADAALYRAKRAGRDRVALS